MYAEVLARNVRAARSRAGLQQEPVAAGMRNLGFTAWLRQTVANVEKARRGLRAEELLGLAIVLDTSVTRLMTPLREDKQIELPSGQPLGVAAVEGYVTGEWITDERILWHGNTPVVNAPAGRKYPAIGEEGGRDGDDQDGGA
jgi:transcriptional regulator with XRE-family HTH domain